MAGNKSSTHEQRCTVCDVPTIYVVLRHRHTQPYCELHYRQGLAIEGIANARQRRSARQLAMRQGQRALGSVAVITFPVSEAISAIAFDQSQGVLMVTMRGDTWRYSGVGQEIAQRLMFAESKGRFFNEHVRGQFIGERV